MHASFKKTNKPMYFRSKAFDFSFHFPVCVFLFKPNAPSSKLPQSKYVYFDTFCPPRDPLCQYLRAS